MSSDVQQQRNSIYSSHDSIRSQQQQQQQQQPNNQHKRNSYVLSPALAPPTPQHIYPTLNGSNNSGSYDNNTYDDYDNYNDISAAAPALPPTPPRSARSSTLHNHTIPRSARHAPTQLTAPASAPTLALPTPVITANGTPVAAPTPTPNAAQGAAPSPMPPATDVIGSVLGDFGIWQLRSILILFLCKLPASWFMACIIYTAPEIRPRSEYQCDASDLNTNQTISSDQCYVLNWNETMATGGGGGNVSGDTPSVLSQQKCTQFLYDADFMSLIMQFNLVCMREILVAWTQYWHLFGVLLGGVIGTKLMLKLSPRTVYIIGMVVQIVFGVVTGYARDFTVHCLFRFLSAICCALMFTAAQAIFVDITGGRYRTGIVILYDTFWSIGIILLPGIASFFDNWSQLYLGITFPTLVLMLLLQWTPESPRWLLKNGAERDVYRVERMLRKAADINDRTFLLPVDFRQQLEQLRVKLRAQPPPASWLQLWRGPRAVLIMLAAHIALACYIVNYMGMLLNIRSFGRDYRVPNTIAMGVAEIIGCFFALHFALKQSPKKFTYAGIFNIIAGLIGCLGWTFTNVTLNPGLKVSLWMIVAVVPKTSVSCAQSMMQGCMAELMPANKKAPFGFSVVTWARIWLLTAPFINLLKKIDVALSLTFFAVLTVLGGICTCLLQPPQSQTKTNLTIIGNQEADKKERSPLTAPIWTVEGDLNNTRL